MAHFHGLQMPMFNGDQLPADDTFSAFQELLQQQCGAMLVPGWHQSHTGSFVPSSKNYEQCRTSECYQSLCQTNGGSAMLTVPPLINQLYAPQNTTTFHKYNEGKVAAGHTKGNAAIRSPPKNHDLEWLNETPGQKNIELLQNRLMVHRNRPVRPVCCNFCKNAGMPFENYSRHNLKDGNGVVTCPLLRSTKCQICGATGDVAHTTNQCPQNQDRSRGRSPRLARTVGEPHSSFASD